MSDKNFSVDDILYEYKKKREDKPKPKPTFDVDEFLASTSSSPDEVKSSPKKFEVNINYDIDSKEQIQPEPSVKKEAHAKKLNEHEEASKKISSEKLRMLISEDTEEKEVHMPTQPAKQENEKPHHSLKHKEKVEREDEELERAALSFGRNTSASTEIKPMKPVRKTSGNTEIIEGLLKMKRERMASRTTEITPINRKNIKDIHLEITSKIIPRTEQIPISSDMSEEEKMHYLSQKRRKKIRDFVLSTDENEEIDQAEVNEEQSASIDDFNSIEDAPLILKDILQLKASLIVRLFILLMAGMLSVYITVANDYNLPIIDAFSIKTNPVSFLFVNSILGIISAFVSYTVIVGGLSKIFSLEADGDSILAVAIVSSLISSMLMLFNTDLFQRHQIHVYIPVAIVALIFNTIGKIMIVKRTERNFRYVAGDSEKYAVFQIEDENRAERYTKGALVDFPSLSAMKKTGFVNDFMRNSYASDMSDKLCRFVVPVVIVIGLMSTLLSVFFNKSATTTTETILTAIATFSASICICSSFALMVAVSYPISKASKRYLEASCAVIGYPAVEEFSATNSVLLDVGQLFPEGTVDFVNLKQISSASIEDGILIAASLACHAGSIMKPTFYKMLKGKTEMLYPVESYIYEDTLGLSGWIENKRVLLGTRELMVNHSIEGLPSSVKEKEYAKGNLVLYLSISGEITTMFIVRIKTSMGITKWLKEFEEQEITVVLRSVDAIVSLNFLSELFDVSPDVFKLLPFRFHKSFDEDVTYSSATSSAMVCSGRFQSFAMLITGAKRLYKTISAGMIITLASIGLGGIISLLMTFLSSLDQLTASVLTMYNFGWLLVVFAYQAFRKS